MKSLNDIWRLVHSTISGWDDISWDDDYGTDSKEIDKLIDDWEKIPPIPNDEKCRFHKWIKTGEGPVSGEEWKNCSRCGISKEDYEESKK